MRITPLRLFVTPPTADSQAYLESLLSRILALSEQELYSPKFEPAIKAVLQRIYALGEAISDWRIVGLLLVLLRHPNLTRLATKVVCKMLPNHKNLFFPVFIMLCGEPRGQEIVELISSEYLQESKMLYDVLLGLLMSQEQKLRLAGCRMVLQTGWKYMATRCIEQGIREAHKLGEREWLQAWQQLIYSPKPPKVEPEAQLDLRRWCVDPNVRFLVKLDDLGDFYTE